MNVFLDDNVPNLVMEYCDKGSLQDSMDRKDNKLCSWKFLLTILHDIARGMRFIHSCGFIHRDIKPANIMVFLFNITVTENIKFNTFSIYRLLVGVVIKKEIILQLELWIMEYLDH